MEPFSIVCRSCASKLKVTKPSAIGQVLGCPKCGTMLTVTHPDGWTPPIEDTQTSNSFEMSSDGGMLGDFEDIESILAKSDAPQKTKTSPQAKPKPRQTSQQRRSSNATGQAPRPNAPLPTPGLKASPKRPTGGNQGNGTVQGNAPQPATSTGDGPILPTDQWSSETTKRKRRAILLVATLVGLFLMITAATVAIVLNNGPSTDQVAERNNEENVNDPRGEGEAQLEQDLNEDQDAPDEEDIKFADAENLDEPTIDDIKDIKEPEKPKNNVVADVPPIGPKNAKNKLRNDGRIEDPLPRRKIGPQPVNGDEDRPVIPRAKNARGIGMVEMEGQTFPQPQKAAPSPFENVESNANDPEINIEPGSKPSGVRKAQPGPRKGLGELSALLNASGTSINEIRDVASSVRNDLPTGLPKYVIEKPNPMRLNLDKLELDVSGLKFDNVPLIQALRSFTMLSGVPITLDARAIKASGKAANPNIEKLISDETLKASLEQIIKPLGFSMFDIGTGLKVSTSQPTESIEKTYPLDQLPRGFNTDRLVRGIKTLIAPEIWTKGVDPATIELQAGRLIANCDQDAHLQIEELITRLTAAAKLIDTPDDASAIAETMSRWERVAKKIEASPNLKHTLQTDIGSFLNKIQKETNVTVLVDWQNVINEGWNPGTIIPGTVEEDSLREVLDHICHSMKLSYLAIDEDTLVITTRERANQLIDLEIYPVNRLVKSGYTETDVLRLVDETLARQIHRREYDPTCQCVIIGGSQAVQKQIGATLKKAMSNSK